MKQDIKSMTLEELQAAFAAMGEPKFRAKQVFVWLHRGATGFDTMTNLSKPLREKLDGLYFITAPTVARKQVSKLDGTIKYLWRLADGNCVESVVMQYHHGNTVCISSEVGCPMGCKFCASTIGGLVRRLEPSELVDQVLFSQLDSGLPISNIVLMGIGEPLDNFDNVMRFLELHPRWLRRGASAPRSRPALPFCARRASGDRRRYCHRCSWGRDSASGRPCRPDAAAR